MRKEKHSFYCWHEKISKKEALKKAEDVLRKTGVPRVEHMMKEYPFQLSGGQRQRVMIAMALVCKPEILIADEPTTALDVTIQAQILDLMNQLKKETGTSILFITHDLGVVAEVCDDVAVMYCGRVVERGDVKTIFANPSHPYTKGLLGSFRDWEMRKRTEVDSGKCSEPEIYAERLQICAAMSIRFGKMPRGRTGIFPDRGRPYQQNAGSAKADSSKQTT